jgi:integrase
MEESAMASIRKRDDNNMLFFDFRFKGIRCREQTALSDTPANRKRLQKVLEKIEREIASDNFDYRNYFPASRFAARFDEIEETAVLAPTASPPGDPNAPLFRDFIEVWFEEKKVEWRKSHTVSTRADMDRRLIPRFGDKVVSQITKADILGFRAELAKATARGKTTSLSPRRINKIMGPLRQVLDEAADRFNFRTPFQNVKQLRFKKPDIQPFTLEEVRRILQTVREDFRSYFAVRFFTGMRTGEVDGLKWKYVDFERRLIMVRETVVKGEEEYTKNDSSQRDIHMSQAVYDALKVQEQRTRHLGKFVFCNRDGGPLDHKNVTNRVWYPLLRYLGLEERRPYQCRHTAATLWLASGENPEWIARQMGHTTTEMLFRVYSRYVPNLTRQDGSAFERLLMQAGALEGSGTPVPTPKIESAHQGARHE